MSCIAESKIDVEDVAELVYGSSCSSAYGGP